MIDRDCWERRSRSGTAVWEVSNLDSSMVGCRRCWYELLRIKFERYETRIDQKQESGAEPISWIPKNQWVLTFDAWTLIGSESGLEGSQSGRPTRQRADYVDWKTLKLPTQFAIQILPRAIHHPDQSSWHTLLIPERDPVLSFVSASSPSLLRLLKNLCRVRFPWTNNLKLWRWFRGLPRMLYFRSLLLPLLCFGTYRTFPSFISVKAKPNQTPQSIDCSRTSKF